MRRAAIITARGGSKRVPRKNVRPFLGRPILLYSIEAALTAGVFDVVMVSTDDKEIAEISAEAGASVPFMRSERTSNDFAATADVIGEVLDEYEKRGVSFDSVCCIYPTAPMITGELLSDGMRLLEERGADSVMPVVKFSFPPLRGVVLREGMLCPRWPEFMQQRSQDLEPIYHDAGQFYCLSVRAFRQQGTMLMHHTVPLFLPEKSVQDIDTEEDWALAEWKYQKGVHGRNS